MTRAALYLRVSSDRQAKEGDSIPVDGSQSNPDGSRLAARHYHHRRFNLKISSGFCRGLFFPRNSWFSVDIPRNPWYHIIKLRDRITTANKGG